jgi:hypothetical protein
MRAGEQSPALFYWPMEIATAQSRLFGEFFGVLSVFYYKRAFMPANSRPVAQRLGAESILPAANSCWTTAS